MVGNPVATTRQQQDNKQENESETSAADIHIRTASKIKSPSKLEGRHGQGSVRAQREVTSILCALRVCCAVRVCCAFACYIQSWFRFA